MKENEVDKIINILESLNVEEVIYYHLPEELLSREVLICTYLHKNHLQYLIPSIKTQYKAEYKIEGDLVKDDWIVLSINDIEVHLLSQEKREYYSIDEHLKSLSKCN